MTQVPSTSAQAPSTSAQVPSASARLHSAAREITVGQLAARSGATVSALHFYEARGLISARRTPGNQRRYPRAMLRRVAFIRASQRVGIPLAQIKAALDTLPERRTPTARDWARLSAAQRQLSTPARNIRRRAQRVEGSIIFADGRTEPITADALLQPLERALRAASWAIMLLAAALAVARLI